MIKNIIFWNKSTNESAMWFAVARPASAKLKLVEK
jgi:hypothetical protein